MIQVLCWPLLAFTLLLCKAGTYAQTQNPEFLPNSGVVLSPKANSTLRTDGRTIHIQYNGIAAEGFESTRLELYLLTMANGVAPEGFGSAASGYQRFGTLAPLANLPPNTFQNATTDTQRASNTVNSYDYHIPLPNNTKAGNIPANLTFLEFYHSPDDQGFVWVSLNYHPVLIDATP